MYIPSDYVKIAIENGPVEIVDFPSYKMVDLSIVMGQFTKSLCLIGKPSINGPFSMAMLVYQRVYIYIHIIILGFSHPPG